MSTLDTLNNIYITLHEEKTIITDYLLDNELTYSVDYFPYHSFKRDDEFYLEHYPIPVINVLSKIDIGIDVDKVFFEFRFSKEAAIDFNYSVFEMFHFEVYGVDDYYDDYYFGDIEEISNNIENSNELEIGISIMITKENLLEETIAVLDVLQNLV